ncbi:MAG: acyl-CoA synthetase [Herpetosiphon sp.]
MLHNSPLFVQIYLGINYAAGVVVPINTAYRQVELGHVLNDAGIRVIFVEPEYLSEIERVRDMAPELLAVLPCDASLAPFLMSPATSQPFQPRANDLATIAYTSGTTGRSKGAMLTYGCQMSNIASVCEAWHWSSADHLLLTLPLFHMHGLMVGLHGSLYSGGALTLQRSFDAAAVFDTLLSRPITLFFGVPTMYARLLTEQARRQERPPALRLYVSGSAPLSPQTFAAFEQAFRQRILERYGMTETLMNLGNPYEGERRPGTVGVPFPRQAARVVDPQTGQPLPTGTDGEIEVRGAHLFAGYWRQPEATAAAFTDDGWFRTGDLGHIGDDGYYTITGRAKELIISGGYNIYPREVEDVLQSCAGVAEVAVLGLSDPQWGEQVVAAIVRSDAALTQEQVIHYCRERLASFKKPRRVEFVDSLPRNALGKIQKHLLRDQLLSRTPRADE